MDYINFLKRAFEIKKTLREIGYIDVEGRTDAIVVYNGKIYTDWSHATALGYTDCFRTNVKLTPSDKIAFLHNIDDVAVMAYCDYDSIFTSEDCSSYSVKELREILKGEYTMLLVGGYEDDILQVEELYPL